MEIESNFIFSVAVLAVGLIFYLITELKKIQDKLHSFEDQKKSINDILQEQKYEISTLKNQIEDTKKLELLELRVQNSIKDQSEKQQKIMDKIQQQQTYDISTLKNQIEDSQKLEVLELRVQKSIHDRYESKFESIARSMDNDRANMRQMMNEYMAKTKESDGNNVFAKLLTYFDQVAESVVNFFGNRQAIKG